MDARPTFAKIVLFAASLMASSALVLFLRMPTARGAISYVQSALSYATSTASLNTTFGSMPTAGDLVVVAISDYRSDADEYKMAASVTDNQGNTYRQAGMEEWMTNASGPNRLDVFYAANVTSTGGSFTVTTTFAGAGNQATVAIEEVSGASGFDQETANEMDSVSAPICGSVSTPSLTSYYNSELFFVAQTHYSAVTTSVASPFTQRQNLESGIDQSLSIADMVSGPTSSSATFNFNQFNNSSCGAILVLFKPTGVKQGHLDSTTFDTGVPNGAQLNSLYWQGTVPAGASVQFQLAVSNSTSGPWSFIGPDGTSGTYFSGSSGNSIDLVSTVSSLGYTLFNGYRYFRYRAQLTSNTTGTVTPTITNVTVNWSP